MDTLRSVAHLQREIGDEAFQELISSDHTEEVRQFAQGLVKKLLPTEMTVGGRTYEILGFLREDCLGADEKSVPGLTMVNRAFEIKANLGEDDGKYLLDHQEDIPVALRGKVAFVFPHWRQADHSNFIKRIFFSKDKWDHGWGDINAGYWNSEDRLLRRKEILPTEMTVGGRIYDLLGFLREGDGDSVAGHTMVERAKEMNANLGEDDGQHLLDHQQDIPVALRGKVTFVFSDWRLPDNPGHACCVCWDGVLWVGLWCWLDDGRWGGHDRLLRRKEVLPTEMTVGGRTYEILGFLRGDEKSVVGHTIVDRAKEMNANLGEDDGQHLLDHQQDIPVALREKAVFIFTDWCRPSGPEAIRRVYYNNKNGCWDKDWGWLDYDFPECGLVLRHK